MIKKSIFPNKAIFFRVTYFYNQREYFLDITRGAQNELIFVAGVYMEGMIEQAVRDINFYERSVA